MEIVLVIIRAVVPRSACMFYNVLVSFPILKNTEVNG